MLPTGLCGEGSLPTGLPQTLRVLCPSVLPVWFQGSPRQAFPLLRPPLWPVPFALPLWPDLLTKAFCVEVSSACYGNRRLTGDRAAEGKGERGGPQSSDPEQMVKKNNSLFASLGVPVQSGSQEFACTQVHVRVWVTPFLLEVLRPGGDSGCCLPS